MAKILVVDDEHLTVEMLSTFLGLIGHNAIGVTSGRQMWDKLAYEDPEVILLDIMMPDANGIDLCRKLRANDRTRNVPIIMISAAAPPLTGEADQAGANGYLRKPVKLDTLKSALDKVGIR